MFYVTTFVRSKFTINLVILWRFVSAHRKQTRQKFQQKMPTSFKNGNSNNISKKHIPNLGINKGFLSIVNYDCSNIDDDFNINLRNIKLLN